MLALKKAAVQDINRGNLDKAVEKLQKLVRISASKGTAADAAVTVPVWSLLAEAYKQKGNLPSATRVNQTILEISPDSYSARLQLIEIFRSMGRYEDSVTHARLLTESNNCPENLRSFLALHFVHSLVLYVQSISIFERKLELLSEATPLLKTLLETNSSVLLHKIYAIFLGIVQKMSLTTFPVVCQKLALNQLGISNRSQLIEKRLSALSFVLKANSEYADSWNDVAMALLDMYELNNDEKILERAESCLKRAISLPSSTQRRSVYWLNLGLLQVKKLQLKRAAHCFIRSLQANQRNDRAWCSLATVCLRSGNTDDAMFFMRTAQQIDSDLMETWCVHAIHAEMTGHYDAMDLYRHATVLRPNRFTVVKYAYFITQNLMNKKSMDEVTMLELERVLDLQHSNTTDETLILSLAILAERFWDLNSAKEFASKLDRSKPQNMAHYSRILLKSQHGDPTCLKEVDVNDVFVQRLLTLYQYSNDDLIQLLLDIPIYQRLLLAIDCQDAVAFRHVYTPSLFPMVALYSILFGKPLPRNIIGVIEDVRPLHRLAEAFPQIRKPEELNLQVQETEHVVVRDHRLTHELSALIIKLNKIQPMFVEDEQIFEAGDQIERQEDLLDEEEEYDE
ncbi:hypothetical protein M3Y95_01185900 [Aphelenchoides besseyi]|nr:hypothetical protein M3Y95_01185900 [Aphelenchoides besseyi]